MSKTLLLCTPIALCLLASASAGDSPAPARFEEYRLDSRLLALHGCPDEDEARCGTHFSCWKREN